MEFKIDKEFLFSRLQYAKEISISGNTSLYYSFFFFEAKNNQLRIKSADNQATMEISIVPNRKNQLDIISEGGFLLLGNKIHSIVSTLPSGLLSVSLDQKEQKINIHPKNENTKIKFSIRSRSVDEYPNIHQPKPKQTHKIDKQEFLRIITHTSFAVSSNTHTTALFLTGIFFEIKDKKLIAVATDRNRISISKMDLDDPIQLQSQKNPQEKSEEAEEDLIIPSKSINFIKSLIMKEDPELYIGQEGKKLFFLLDEFLVAVNIISGEYYKYESILPENASKQSPRDTVKAKTKELLQAIERVSSIANDKRDAEIELSIHNDYLIISNKEPNEGLGTETIGCQLNNNTNAEIKNKVVKAYFFTEPLRVTSSEYVQIDFGAEKRDLIRLKPLSEQDTMHLATPIVQQS